VLYPGPSSIFRSELFKATDHELLSFGIPHPPSVSTTASTSFHNPVLAECVALFFRWQFPQNMFIDRDKFLMDYLGCKGSEEPCKAALVYAVGSLGALLSPNPGTRQLAETYVNLAIVSLESHGLLNAHEASVQALILCAFYKIGKGNLSKAWMLSGMLETSRLKSCWLTTKKVLHIACQMISSWLKALWTRSKDILIHRTRSYTRICLQTALYPISLPLYAE
jgi:hypothetical protein